MSRPPTKVDGQLDASLRRIGDALEQNRTYYAAMAEQIAAGRRASAAERIAESAARIEARTADVTERLVARVAENDVRIATKLERRAERLRRRAERRSAREDREGAAGIPGGIVQLVIAIVCLVYAIRQPQFFWMIFVAAGFGMSAATSFARAARAGRASREQSEAEGGREQTATSSKAEAAERVESATPATRPPASAPAQPVVEAEPPDPKVARIQSLCDRLLAELESGPPIVREVVTEPHATIGGLRQACVETARRERELRAVLGSQDESALAAERDSLARRVGAETDAIVRDRLSQALKALEQQLANRAELVTAATRLEAENTRILYTLENLHMQLLRARSTDIGAPELGGKLRESLRALGTQIDAVAEALEWASTPAAAEAAAGEQPAAPSGGAELTGAQADTQRAERADAARRAQARQAQRP